MSLDSPENRQIASWVAAAFGGTPRYVTYTQNPELLGVDIISARDRPGSGVSSFSTIGLSEHPMVGPEGEFPTRLELAGGCENAVEFFPDLLAAAAFHVMRTAGVYYPGAVIMNCVQAFTESSALPHLFLAAPFLWEQLTTLDLTTRRISWLLVVPIAESEYLYKKEHGDVAFKNLLERRGVDVFDLYRQPVV